MSIDRGPDELTSRIAQLEETIGNAKRWVIVIGAALGLTSVGSFLQVNTRVNSWSKEAGLEAAKDRVAKLDETIGPVEKRVKDLEKRTGDLDLALNKGTILAKLKDSPIGVHVPYKSSKTYGPFTAPFPVKNAWYQIVESSGFANSTEYAIEVAIKEGNQVAVNVRNDAGAVTLRLKLDLFVSAY